jgi:hypothetical protein
LPSIPRSVSETPAGAAAIQLPYASIAQTPFSVGAASDISAKEDKSNKGIANGYAPLDATSKVPSGNLPTIDVSGQISTHNSATTSVHGIANTANLVTTSILASHEADTTSVHGIANTATLVVTSDSRLSDPRRPLPYPVLSETLFSGVTAEKRVHTRSYNSGDQLWETNVAVTQLPLVLDAYHDPAVIYENGEEGWSITTSSAVVAFGTSNTSGLIFESDDEGAKIMRLGAIVVPPLPNPAPPSPYTTQATFIESFSAIIFKAGGAWDSSAFASTWNSVSPSRNIFNSRTFNDQSETIKEWQLEAGYGPSYDSFNVAMASPNILLRCSKRYTSWTNGVSPSVEGNGNIIVEIIFYGIPKSLSFGTTAGTYCQGNDSRLSNSRTPTAHTHAMSDVTSLQATLIAFAIALG